MDLFIDLGYWVLDIVYDIAEAISPNNYELMLFLYRNDNNRTALIVGLIFFIIIFIIAVKILRSIFNPKQASVVNDQSRQKASKANGHTNSKNKMYNISGNLEDKNSDWLAQQYNDEEKSRITCIAGEIISPMRGQPMSARDLKNSHHQDCDADINFQEHRKTHRR